MNNALSDLQTVRLNETADAVIILDQTALPARKKYLSLSSAEEVWEAIRQLKVRGAPAIGITAAYGLYVAIQSLDTPRFEDLDNALTHISDYLATSRPTAVNLTAALERMQQCARRDPTKSIDEIKQNLLAEAHAIRDEDVAACRQIGTYALSLLRPGIGLLTHCNAGHLAVSAYGTALAPIYLGQEQGYNFKVFADETRPLLQGARLTAYELHHAGVDVTLLCDNMASEVMHKGWIQAVVVGCDRIAANGDTANKIGTSGVAVLAHHYGIPFYVLGPTTTIDRRCSTGDSIVIEERNPDEITEMWYSERMAPQGVKVYNPAFDVTPASLITAIITEKGVARFPFDDTFQQWLTEPTHLR